MAEFDVRIKLKRDTSANWTANNPVLLNGERIIVDTDAGEVRYKTGDGTKTYIQLPFDDEAVRNLVDSKYTDLQERINNLAVNGGAVQSDWSVTDDTSLAFIKNKPEIPNVDGLATEEFVTERLANVSISWASF